MIHKLKERMAHLRLGDSLDKCIDMGAMVDPAHLKSVAKYVEEAQADGAEVTKEYTHSYSTFHNYLTTDIQMQT